MKTNLKPLKVWAATSMSLLALSVNAACTPVSHVRGNMIEEKELVQVQPGQTTQNDVLSQFGTPSTRAGFDPNTWIYVGTKTERYAFLSPRIEEHHVTVFTFDEAGTLQAVRRLSKDDLMNINYSRDQTPTAGDDYTILQQLVGNIGRFQGADSRTAGQRQ